VIDVIQRGNVSIFQIRHGKANALDVELCDAIVAHLEDFRDASAQALVLTSQGRIFSAGVDLVRVLHDGPDYIRVFMPSLSKAFETLFCYPKPVIAAINGHAIAGGCVLGCAADHRIMARQSGRIGVPEMLVGVPFPTVALEIMRFAAAPQYFESLIYGGATLDPDKALEQGLLDEVVEPGELLERAVEVAAKLAALPPAAFALTKSQIRQPVLQRIREDGPGFDVASERIWADPKTRAAIQDYVARTLKKS
jgi:enoyl-CoA hydratase